MNSPIFLQEAQPRAAAGASFEVHEWSGSGPDYLHVHHADDEAWHVLEGSLVFRFLDGEREARAGTTVMVPAGVAHTFADPAGNARYLMILTPNLSRMIRELHQTPYARHGEVLQRHNSAIVASPDQAPAR